MLKIASQHRYSSYDQTSNVGLIRYKANNLDESYNVLVSAMQEISKRVATRNPGAIQGLISNMDARLSNEIRTKIIPIEVT